MSQFLIYIFAILFASVAYVYWSLRARFQFWEKKKVPFSKPSSIIFGSCGDFILGRITLKEHSLRLYNEFKEHKFGGFFNFCQPCLLVKDPQLIKRILLQDSEFFPHRSPHYLTKGNPLQSNLLQLPGTISKVTRKKLAPGFSLSKTKNMFDQIDIYTVELLKIVEHSIDSNSGINAKHLLSR